MYIIELAFDDRPERLEARPAHADPYYRTPGVTVARRQEWTPIVGA